MGRLPAGLILASLVACTPADPCADGACGTGATFAITRKNSVDPYWLRVEPAGGAAAAIACPGPASGPLACSEAGVEFTGSAASFTFVAKVPGGRFERRTVTPSYDDAGHARLEVAPAALAAFVTTADYRTGFTRETGVADFLAQALEVPGELGATHVVKFYVDLSGEPVAYFQDTRKHRFHYDFVRNVLGRPQTLSQFEAATYRGTGRTGLAGSLVLYADRPGSPITVEFFPSDDLTPDQAVLALRLLHERLPFAPYGSGDHRLSYLPAGSVQQAQARAAQATFEAWGEPILPREELYAGLTRQLLNPGVAFGTLRTIEADAIDRSAVSFHDVIVLPLLPNHLPIVGGTITGELQTPLAHVNVAARARGTPNLALPGVEEDPRVKPLLGKLVRFEVTRSDFTLREATTGEAEAFWAARSEQPHFVPEADVDRAGLPAFEELGFADAKSVGVKAANLAELAKVLPNETPVGGFAVPFHHYDAFLHAARVTPPLCDGARAECPAEGRSVATCDAARALCLPAEALEEVFADHVHRLLGEPRFTSDSPVREAALAALRWMISNAPVDSAFAAALDARVAERMGTAKVKLRSSTNAEDLPRFSGAGLYDSFGAAATGDKRASSRVRLVWASTWSWRAFEERAFWNIDQEALRMAVLVNPSYENEEANGVLVTQNLANPALTGMYVNVQKGEAAVTNPLEGELPETFSIIAGPSGLQVARERFSSLSPGVPLLSDAEVTGLYRSSLAVQLHFAPLYGVEPEDLKLDLEFKLRAGDRKLQFKQVRPYYERPAAP